jgi:hypothetical protein
MLHTYYTSNLPLSCYVLNWTVSVHTYHHLELGLVWWNVQCAMCNVQCTMCNIQFTLYNVQWTMYNVQCTIHTVQCTMSIVQCTLCNVQCTMFNVQCTMYNVQCTMYNVLTIENYHRLQTNLVFRSNRLDATTYGHHIIIYTVCLSSSNLWTIRSSSSWRCQRAIKTLFAHRPVSQCTPTKAWARHNYFQSRDIYFQSRAERWSICNRRSPNVSCAYSSDLFKV